MKRRPNLLPAGFKEDLFRRNRFYVARQTNEDLPYILKYGTEDNLMNGTDYSHADQLAEIEALDVIEQRAANGEISATVARKILDDNQRRFYADSQLCGKCAAWSKSGFAQKVTLGPCVTEDCRDC